MIEHIDGKAYCACKRCGVKWNVSRYYIEHPGGYLCPKCRDKLRRGKA